MKYSDFLSDSDLRTLANSMNSRAKSAKASGRVTVSDLRHRIYSSGGQCAYCKVSLVNADFECDHIIPLGRGGGNIPDNIAVACPSCNRSKSDKHPARFAQETIARTGITTPLLERILTHYQAEATVQQSLFPNDDHSESTIQQDESLPDEPPPYVWGQ
ncbi:MAG: HNH endonuclease signature motif containing protein [Chloroflexota bacterium]